MINLRYHIVSLIAVFLALAIGLIAGTTLDERVEVLLEAQQRSLAQTKDELRAERDALLRELSLWESFGEASIPPLLADKLTGRSVLLVAQDPPDEELLSLIEDAVTDAGGTRAGRIVLTGKWRLEEDAEVDQLALASGAGSGGRVELTAAAARLLASRLKAPGDPRSSTDLLNRLADAGFLRLEDLGSGPQPEAGTAVVLVGSAGEQPMPPQDFTTAFLKGLSGVPASAAERLSAPVSVAELVRGDGELRETIASADHADTLPGRLALVEALRRVLAGLPAVHYGVRRGASAIAPPPAA